MSRNNCETRGKLNLLLLILPLMIQIFAASAQAPALANSHGKFPGKGSYNAWINGNTLLGFGNKSASEGHLDQAIDYYKKAIHTYGFDGTYYLNLGNALAMKANYNLAEQSFAKAAELDSHNAQAWLNLGHMCIKEGKNSEAVSALRKAAKLTHSESERAGIENTIANLKLVDPSSHDSAKKKKKRQKENAESPLKRGE